MKKYYIDINQYEFLINKFPEILKKFSGKTLILSLIQEDRSLEKKLKISDEIIFDNSDYINNTVNFYKAIMEINDNLDIMPSSYKMKDTTVDFNRFIDELEDEEYENVIVLFDDKLEIENKPTLTEKDELKEIFKGIDIFEFEENDKEEHENEDTDNIKNIENTEEEKEAESEEIEDIDTINKSDKKENEENIKEDNEKDQVKRISIFEKIKRLFRKNG